MERRDYHAPVAKPLTVELGPPSATSPKNSPPLSTSPLTGSRHMPSPQERRTARQLSATMEHLITTIDSRMQRTQHAISIVSGIAANLHSAGKRAQLHITNNKVSPQPCHQPPPC